MVEEVLAGEEGLAAIEFGHDAAHRPDINCFGVLTGIEDDFRSPIPASDDILGLLLFFFDVAAGQPQVADFEIAGFVLDKGRSTRRRLLGLMSRWITLAECMKRRPRRSW